MVEIQDVAIKEYVTQEEANRQIEGVEKKNLFPEKEQERIIRKIDEWFLQVKDKFPPIGLELIAERRKTDGSPLMSLKEISDSLYLPEGISFPPELFELFDAILQDSARDPVLGKQPLKLVLESTGNVGTHVEDRGYHLDTRQIYWNDQGQRTGYDPKRSLDKYMVFVGRPGSLIAHGKIDASLTQQQGNALTGELFSGHGNLRPVLSQLMPDSIYKVAVGDLLHNPPPHNQGLLITGSFNNDPLAHTAMKDMSIKSPIRAIRSE